MYLGKVWGTFANSKGEPWSKMKAKKYSNVLELAAAKFAVVSFIKMSPVAKVAHSQMGNTVALRYIKPMGDTHKESFQIWPRNFGLPDNKWNHDYLPGILGNFRCWSIRKLKETL